jgi:hypothetical protein
MARLWLSVLVAIAVALGVSLPIYRRATRNDVHVVNGLSYPVRVTIGPQAIEVPSGQRKELHALEAGTTLPVDVANANGGRVEQGLIFVRGGGRTVIYNVGGAAPVVDSLIVYSEHPSDSPPQPHVHCGERVIELDAIDYEFVTPPQSISVDSNSGPVRKTVVSVHGGVEGCEGWALDKNRDELFEELLAIDRGHQELEPRTRLAALDAHVSAHPDDVGAHRALQTLLESHGLEELARSRYRDAGRRPDASEIDRYLWARIAPAPERGAVLEEALKRFPDSPWLHWIAVYRREAKDDWEGALKEVERIERTKPPEELASQVASAHVRTLLYLGRPKDAYEVGTRYLTERKDLDPSFGCAFTVAARASQKTVDLSSAMLPPVQRWVGVVSGEFKPEARTSDPLQSLTLLLKDALQDPEPALRTAQDASEYDLMLAGAPILLPLLYEAWRTGDPVSTRLERVVAGQVDFPRRLHFILSGALDPELEELAVEDRAGLWLARGRFLEGTGEEPASAYALVKKLDRIHFVPSQMLERWPHPKHEDQAFAWSMPPKDAPAPAKVRDRTRNGGPP